MGSKLRQVIQWSDVCLRTNEPRGSRGKRCPQLPNRPGGSLGLWLCNPMTDILSWHFTTLARRLQRWRDTLHLYAANSTRPEYHSHAIEHTKIISFENLWDFFVSGTLKSPPCLDPIDPPRAGDFSFLWRLPYSVFRPANAELELRFSCQRRGSLLRLPRSRKNSMTPGALVNDCGGSASPKGWP